MPGILPMKVIKVGTSSQSRIAQACDRCRSKKIRCDGIRPTCSQCSTVGFECKTSDKLSRRAFPRGYTESLEERVRQLENEVRELKDLLDEKDEKIDMLSKMHGNRRPSAEIPRPTSSAKGAAADVKVEVVSPPTSAKEDTFRVQASPLLLGVENSDSYFMGASSGRAFIETFKRRIQESGKSCSDFNPESFLHIQGCYPLVAKTPSQTIRLPPRLFSDRCVNVYFQEWAPLFPVLHKPSFLRVYEEFVADPEKVKSNHKLAQLYLVFSIASLSGEQPDLEQIAACEVQWQKALEAILMDNTIITLQCLVLGLIYCTVRADYKRLQHYKGIAIGLSHRLGLHQSQKRFAFGALTIETRKRVFWTLYTLDCFSAAILGLPKLLKDADVHTEYPNNVDDEYVTEKGVQPSLPGENTRISSALALFRVSRILGKVLTTLYPASTSHELSLQQMSALEAELDEWSEALPQHLKLNFKQDKPSTDVTGSRSPLLALANYYIRILIHRPAVGSSLGSKAAPSLISVGDSSKHIIQIIQLLEERGLAFSFCLNKADVLVLCGMALLYQILDLKQDSKMMKEAERQVNAIIKANEKAKAPGSYDFRKVAGMLIKLDELPQQKTSLPSPARSTPETMAAPPVRKSPAVPQATVPRKQSTVGRHVGAHVSETDLLMQQEKLRRMSSQQMQTSQKMQKSRSRTSFEEQRQEGAPLRRSHPTSLPMASAQMHGQQAQAAMIARVSPPLTSAVQNLDYLNLSLNSSPSPTQPASPAEARQRHRSPYRHQSQQLYPTSQPLPIPQPQPSQGVSTAEWEALLATMDNGQLNVYDAIYGGSALALGGTPPMTHSLSHSQSHSHLPTTTTTAATAYSTSASGASGSGNGWSPDHFDLSTFSLADYAGSLPTTVSVGTSMTTSRSLLSLHSETGSLSSGEELAGSDLGLSVSSLEQLTGAGGLLPVGSEGWAVDGLEGVGGYGL
jgi:hypothetical protein